MELERMTWGALGVLSFVALIIWLRWEGPREDQKKNGPPQAGDRWDKRSNKYDT
jgi:hypothetical protein